MKKLFSLFLFITIPIVSYAQNLSKNSAFSYISVGLYGGVSTFEFSTFKGSALLELKTNLSKNIYLHLSVGQYLFNKNEIHTFKDFNTYEDGFVANDYNSTIYHYKVTPISIGISYLFFQQHSSPYFIIEAGYNYYEQTSNISRIIKTKFYNSRDEIPIEYKISDKKDSFNLGIGLGVYYNMSPHWKMDMRYVYKYNTIFDNIDHIIIGCSYLL